jgi:hypothetical protein
VTKPPTAAADALRALRREAAAFSAEFPVTLANHLPMILVALHRMGASPARLRRFFAAYRDGNGLVPLPQPVAPIDRGAWTAALGDRSREGDYRVFFAGEVARLGAAGAARTYLPALVPGIAASAFHALMRLGYAVLEDDGAEVAAALAAWAATFLDLGRARGAPPASDDPGAVLARMNGIAAFRRVVPESDLVWHNMRAVAARPEFAGAADWLAIAPDTPRRIAATALTLFAATPCFCALHALTGSHWLRLALPMFPDPGEASRYFWQGVAALVPKIGFPALPAPETLAAWRALPAPAWPEILERATARPDAAAADEESVHDISLVFSAWQEEQEYSDPLYRIVAARRLGMIA